MINAAANYHQLLCQTGTENLLGSQGSEKCCWLAFGFKPGKSLGHQQTESGKYNAVLTYSNFHFWSILCDVLRKIFPRGHVSAIAIMFTTIRVS